MAAIFWAASYVALNFANSDGFIIISWRISDYKSSMFSSPTTTAFYDEISLILLIKASFWCCHLGCLIRSSRLFTLVISVVCPDHPSCLITSNLCFDFKRLQKWTVPLCLFSFSSPLALCIAAPRWCTFVKITQPHPPKKKHSLTPIPLSEGEGSRMFCGCLTLRRLLRRWILRILLYAQRIV